MPVGGFIFPEKLVSALHKLWWVQDKECALSNLAQSDEIFIKFMLHIYINLLYGAANLQ